MEYALIQVLPDVPAGGVFAGIDWATADHVACVVDMAGRVKDRFSAAHDKAGIEALITRLRRAGATEVAIERGDGVLVEALLAAGLTVVVITSRQVKNLRARYGPPAPRTTGSMRSCWQTRCARTGRGCGRWSRTRPRPSRCGRRCGPAGTWSRTGWRHATSCAPTWPRRSPPRIGLFFDLDSPISLAFLARFGSQDAAADLDEQAIAAWLKTIPARGKHGPGQRAVRPAAAARARGVTGEHGAAQAGITAALTATVGMLAAQIKTLETGIGTQLAAHPDAHIFTSLPRAGTLRAARLLAEIGDCRSRFPDPRVTGRPGRGRPGHPPSPARIPRTASGGRSTGQLRDAVCNFADDSRHASPWAAAIYDAARARGKDHPHAVRILARAWINIIWRCWQDGTAYDPAKHNALQPSWSSSKPPRARHREPEKTR